MLGPERPGDDGDGRRIGGGSPTLAWRLTAPAARQPLGGGRASRTASAETRAPPALPLPPPLRAPRHRSARGAAPRAAPAAARSPRAAPPASSCSAEPLRDGRAGRPAAGGRPAHAPP